MIIVNLKNMTKWGRKMIKYTNDGKKVSIVGKLNNNETIVQEIFVTEKGDELPSGENFVVISLHDEPVLSWEVRNCKNLKDETEKIKLDLKELDDKYKQAKEQLKAITAIVRSSKRLAELLPEAKLDIFSAFITGNIKYLVTDEYTIKPPIKMIDEIIDWKDFSCNERRFDSIKLCSVLGKSEGKMEYNISRYSDGSGHGCTVYPFTNYKDAISCIKERAEKQIDNKYLTQESYKICIDMGIIFSDEYKTKYKKYKEEKVQKKLIQKKMELFNQETAIKKLMTELTELNN